VLTKHAAIGYAPRCTRVYSHAGRILTPMLEDAGNAQP
jgi:hypothetical protein